MNKIYKNVEITRRIIKCALEVHSVLGCGFLERIYENSMKIECSVEGLKTVSQNPVDVFYKGHTVGEHRLDLLVEDKVIAELKACKGIESIHYAQLLHYLRATGIETGLLLNFGTQHLEIRRVSLDNR